MDALLLVRDGLVVPHDLEVEVYGGEVGELPYSGLHRSCRVLCAVGLPDGRLSEPDVLQPDDDLLVQDVELDHAALVVLDGLVLADPDGSDDSLHPAERPIAERDAVVVGR